MVQSRSAQCSDWNWRRRGAVGGWARADCEFTSNNYKIVHDIHAQIDGGIVYVNDGRAFALSEAVFGAGRGHDMTLGLILEQVLARG